MRPFFYKSRTYSEHVQCGYRFRFYPRVDQEEFLIRSLGCARFVFNRALAARQQAWNDSKQSLGYKQTSALLTQWKKDPEVSWLNEVSSVPLQQALRHLDRAYQNFFKGIARFPRFRRRHGSQSMEFTRSAFQIRNGELYLAKLKQPMDARIAALIIKAFIAPARPPAM